MRKYTNEQLSRILSEHAAGNLIAGGGGSPVIRFCWNWAKTYKSCIEQAAFGYESEVEFMHYAMLWFDENYKNAWTPDRLLREIEEQGLA